MSSSGSPMKRAGALLVVLGLATSGTGTATADPVYGTSPFDIVNDTKYDLVFWDYNTTAKYPQTGPDHGNRAKPGQKFRFELRQMDGSRSQKRTDGRTTIVANFHTFDAAADHRRHRSPARVRPRPVARRSRRDARARGRRPRRVVTQRAHRRDRPHRHRHQQHLGRGGGPSRGNCSLRAARRECRTRPAGGSRCPCRSAASRCAGVPWVRRSHLLSTIDSTTRVADRNAASSMPTEADHTPSRQSACCSIARDCAQVGWRLRNSGACTVNWTMWPISWPIVDAMRSPTPGPAAGRRASGRGTAQSGRRRRRTDS